MRPLFRMYREIIPLLKKKTAAYFDHGGIYFQETLHFWGLLQNQCYGWNREGRPVAEPESHWIGWHYNSGLELLALMIAYNEYTEDDAFLMDELIPMATEVLRFWDEHYQRDAQGRLDIYPAQSLETYQDARNPTPDVAGLVWVLDFLLQLPNSDVAQAERATWSRLRDELPAIPLTAEKLLASAENIYAERKNCENPELYAIFPFRHFVLGKPGADLGRESFRQRITKWNRGWAQDPIQAAYVGLADEAAAMVMERCSQVEKGSHFPAFWNAHFDWTPDQDHGNVLMVALQAMLLHAYDEKIHLFPAWPRQWDVRFRLHAPQSTVVEASLKNGLLEWFSVEPKSREKDIVLLLPSVGS